jgi:tetratricopeptide (TPR) repeat protein
MLQHEQHMLPVDLLFDDERIGEFVKSIQIDSPYQQMLFDGVLTESVRDEKLFVYFTVEGYFHYVLGEVIHNRTEGLGAEALKQIVEENNLIGAKEGIEQCLIRDVKKNDYTRLLVLIDFGDEALNLTVVPLAEAFSSSIKILDNNHFDFEKSKNILKKLYTSPTINDNLVMIKCFDYLKLKYRFNEINIFQESLEIIAQQKLSDENLLLMLKIFPWISEKEIKTYYLSYFENLSMSKRISSLMKWEINSTLAHYYKQISDYQKAIQLLEKVIKFERKTFGKSSVEYSASLNFKGTLEVIQGQYLLARKLFRKELKLRENNSKSLQNDPLITACLHNIALTFHYQGNYIQAVKYYTAALERRQKEGGRYCSATIGTMANLAITYLESGSRLELAEKYLEEAIHRNINLQGRYSDNSTIIPYLARIKFEKGELSNAENLLLMNLESRERLFGNKSREAAFSHADLMNFYKELNSFDKALFHAQIQNGILIDVLGNKHEFTISSYSELGECLFAIGKINDAMNSFQKAISLSLKYNNSDQISIGLIYNTLGNSFRDISDFKNSKLYYTNAYSIFYKNLGVDHEYTKLINKKLKEINDL